VERNVERGSGVTIHDHVVVSIRSGSERERFRLATDRVVRMADAAGSRVARLTAASLDGECSEIVGQAINLKEHLRIRHVVLGIPQQTLAPRASEQSPAAPVHTPAPARGGTPPWFWVAGGIGAAGLVTGGITGALVFSKKSEIDDNCRRFDCNRQGKQAADSAQTLALVSTVGFAVGVVGCATAAVLLLTSPKEERAAARRLDMNVAASDSSAMLGLTKRF
jgi:hypothetical protein